MSHGQFLKHFLQIGFWFVAFYLQLFFSFCQKRFIRKLANAQLFNLGFINLCLLCLCYGWCRTLQLLQWDQCRVYQTIIGSGAGHTGCATEVFQFFYFVGYFFFGGDLFWSSQSVIFIESLCMGNNVFIALKTDFSSNENKSEALNRGFALLYNWIRM